MAVRPASILLSCAELMRSAQAVTLKNTRTCTNADVTVLFNNTSRRRSSAAVAPSARRPPPWMEERRHRSTPVVFDQPTSSSIDVDVF